MAVTLMMWWGVCRSGFRRERGRYLSHAGTHSHIYVHPRTPPVPYLVEAEPPLEAPLHGALERLALGAAREVAAAVRVWARGMRGYACM